MCGYVQNINLIKFFLLFIYFQKLQSVCQVLAFTPQVRLSELWTQVRTPAKTSTNSLVGAGSGTTPFLKGSQAGASSARSSYRIS